MKLTQALNKAYNQNPILVLGASAVAIFFGYRAINKAITKPRVPVVPNIPPVPGKGQNKYTFGIQEYANFADQIYSALRPNGTDEELVSRILSKMKTYDDVLALIDAYGKRPLKTPFQFNTDPYSLSESFYYDMDFDEIERYVNAPLKRTGFKF
jgi:hypothetical protein